MVTALRAAWLRFSIRRQEVRRQIAHDDAQHHRQRARDAAAKKADAAERIEAASRELAGLERRLTVRRIERARPC
ncbi:MAG: hypothetical protein GY848_15095 [Methyloversatilis sp.]|nr:hypothetical protein [Methyloversatilis sp.]